MVIATDGIDRYPSVMENMTKTYGKLDKTEAKARMERIFHYQFCQLDRQILLFGY
jgi:hypothetical protein